MKLSGKFILLLGCLALATCHDPGIIRKPTSSGVLDNLDITTGQSRSVPAPEFAGFVGDGYDMLKLSASPLEALKSNCLSDMEVRRNVGEARSYSRNFIAENEFSLDFNLNYNQETSANIKLFDVISASGGVNMNILDNLHFSSKVIAMVGIVEYSDSTIFINEGTMTPEAATLYETNRYLFEQQYGTGYCEKAELGEKLIVVFTYTFQDFKNYTKLDYKTNAEAHFLEIFTGKNSTSQAMDMSIFFQNTQIRSYCYATGNFVPGYIGTREDFVAQYNAWIAYTNAKINSSPTSLSVINRVYQPYSKILTLQESTSIDLYADMLYAWKKTASQIKIVKDDTTDSALIQNCNSALALIQAEMDKCQAKAADARFPLPDEFPAIQKQWILKTSLPLYKLKITQPVPVAFPHSSEWISGTINELDQQVFDYYLVTPEDSLTAEINQLKAVNPGTVIEYEKMIGYIPQLNVEDTYPLYALNGKQKWFFFLTTDKDERNRRLYNEGYTLLPQGTILGYLFKQQLDNFTPLIQVQMRIDNSFTITNQMSGTSAINATTANSFIDGFYTFVQTEKDYWNTVHTATSSRTATGTAQVVVPLLPNLTSMPYNLTLIKNSTFTPTINRTSGYLPAAE